jgi:hypothetical protein
MGQLAQDLIESDLPAALGLLQEMPAGATRQNAFLNVAFQWARMDPAAAADWAQQNQEGTNNFGVTSILINGRRVIREPRSIGPRLCPMANRAKENGSARR